MDNELKPSKNLHKDGHSIYFTLSLLLLGVVIVMGSYMFYQSDQNKHQLSMALDEVDSLSEQVTDLSTREEEERMAIEELKGDYEVLKEELDEKDEVSVPNPAGWTELSRDSFWADRYATEESDYLFPGLKVFYPGNWNFSCCQSAEDFSEHFIYSPTFETDEGQPYIAIRDYSLLACPEGAESCSLDERVELSPQEYYERLEVEALDFGIEDYVQEQIGARGLSYLEPVTGARHYLFYTDSDVLEVIFYEHEKLGNRFVFDFMGMIEAEDN